MFTKITARLFTGGLFIQIFFFFLDRQAAYLYKFLFFIPALAKAKLGYSRHCHKSVCVYVCVCVRLSTKSFFSETTRPNPSKTDRRML